MEQEQSFFTKVSTYKDKERIFALILETKSLLECMLQNKTLIYLKPEEFRESQLIVYFDKERLEKQNVIVTISLGSEKYFTKTVLSRHDISSLYILDLSSPIFKLQRRNSFRVQIPAGYLSKIILTSINGNPCSQRLTLSDLSGGGFSFEIPPESNLTLQDQDLIDGEIQIGGKFKKSIKAQVRHVFPFGSQGSGLLKVGTEFVELPPSDQQEIINQIMDIHRDTFSKFKIGSR